MAYLMSQIKTDDAKKKVPAKAEPDRDTFKSEAPAKTVVAADAVGVRWRKGVVASGDCFVCDSAKKQQIAERFDAIVCEMEGGAIGHVCYVNQVDFCVLRAVSDNGDENANQDYSIALELASGNALKVLEEFLKRLAKA